MVGRGFLSPPLVYIVPGSATSGTRMLSRLSWQSALAPSARSDKFRGLSTLFPPLSSMQQIRSRSTKQPQGKTHSNNENGHEHSVGKDELHTHSHSILGHSHAHGEDEHGHGYGHDPEQILAALKGSGVWLGSGCSKLRTAYSPRSPDDRGSRITLIGLYSNVIRTSVKGFAGWYMHSASLLADAGHSLSG